MMTDVESSKAPVPPPPPNFFLRLASSHLSFCITMLDACRVMWSERIFKDVCFCGCQWGRGGRGEGEQVIFQFSVRCWHPAPHAYTQFLSLTHKHTHTHTKTHTHTHTVHTARIRTHARKHPHTPREQSVINECCRRWHIAMSFIYYIYIKYIYNIYI